MSEVDSQPHPLAEDTGFAGTIPASSDDRAARNGSEPAWPFHDFSSGMTKRELFAAMIMQGLASNSIPGSHHVAHRQAEEAVFKADALLKELAK